MYAITGITGQVGSEVARNLLADPFASAIVAQRGERALPEGTMMRNRCRGHGMTPARWPSLAGADADYYIPMPPNFDPAPGFPEARSLVASVRSAIETANPAVIYYLSTFRGAQASTAVSSHSSTLREYRVEGENYCSAATF